MLFAYFVLALALLSRLLPPMLHITAMNFTAVGGSLLFFGAKRPRWQCGIAVAAMMATDILLTVYAYHYAFHVTGYLVTWAWYAGVCLFGHRILQQTTFGRVVAGVAGSATSFFLLSNFMVWTGTMYAHTWSGLASCYLRALPFYRNDLIATGVVAGVLFGLPVLAANLTTHSDGAQRAA